MVLSWLISTLGTFKILSQFCLKNDLQMALVVLLRVFKVVFKTLQKFEISHLITKMTNINIWITVTFTYDLFYFSQIIY